MLRKVKTFTSFFTLSVRFDIRGMISNVFSYRNWSIRIRFSQFKSINIPLVKNILQFNSRNIFQS